MDTRVTTRRCKNHLKLRSSWRGLWPQPNSKSEYRNPKQFQMVKNAMLKNFDSFPRSARECESRDLCILLQPPEGVCLQPGFTPATGRGASYHRIPTQSVGTRKRALEREKRGNTKYYEDNAHTKDGRPVHNQ